MLQALNLKAWLIRLIDARVLDPENVRAISRTQRARVGAFRGYSSPLAGGEPEIEEQHVAAPTACGSYDAHISGPRPVPSGLRVPLDGEGKNFRVQCAPGDGPPVAGWTRDWQDDAPLGE